MNEIDPSPNVASVLASRSVADWIYMLRLCPTEAIQTELETIKRLGFRRLSLCISTPRAETQSLIEILPRVVHSLSQSGFAPVHLNFHLDGPFSPIDRARTHVKGEIKRLTLAIDAAAKVGIRHITVAIAPQPLGTNESRLQDDIFTYALEVMHAVRYEAELRAVSIAVVAGMSGFLNSPAEARDFIDECNSPWIGACLPIVEIRRSGSPVDWFLTLGRRAFFGLIELSANESDSEMLAQNSLRALRTINPDCPIILQATGLTEPQILERILLFHAVMESKRNA